MTKFDSNYAIGLCVFRPEDAGSVVYIQGFGTCGKLTLSDLKSKLLQNSSKLVAVYLFANS